MVINRINTRSPSNDMIATGSRIGIKKRGMSDNVKVSSGVMVNNHRSTAIGVISSFESNFRKSATGCRRPQGPVVSGPMRF